MPRRRSLRAAGALVFAMGLVIGVLGGRTLAAFSSSTSNGPNSFGAKRIFPTSPTTAAWDLRDASSGTEANSSDVLSFNDGLIKTTGNWSSAFSTTRYLDFDLGAPLPPGLSVSGATFDFRFADNVSGDTASFYFEVRRLSTNTVIQTHGSSGTPVGSVTGTTQQTFSTAISEVNTTDIANDLRIRVYMKESASKAVRVDQGTVTGSSPYASFTLYENSSTDASTGTATTTAWSLAGSGGTAYTDATNWATSFSATKYLKFTFPAYLPTGATVTSVSFSDAYKTNAGSSSTTCQYFEVYNGASLLATHGSSGSPYSCNSSNTTYVTDTVSLTEVTTATAANNLIIKMYFKSSGAVKSQHDLATVTINYYLD